MAGYRRRRQAGLTKKQAHRRRSKRALNAKLRATSDPVERLTAAYDYLRSALASVGTHVYAHEEIEECARYLITTGDGLLNPGHQGGNEQTTRSA